MTQGRHAGRGVIGFHRLQFQARLMCARSSPRAILGSLADGLVISRMTFVAVLMGAAVPAWAEPCNPVIDGTYCATQMTRRSDRSTSSGGYFPPIQRIAPDIGPWTDQPATLGALTFRGGETCIGLFRRGACN